MAKTYPVWIRVVTGVRLEIEAESPEEAAKKATEVDFGEFMNRDIRLEDGGDVAKHMQYDDGTEHQGITVGDEGDEVHWDRGDSSFLKPNEKKGWEPCSPGCKGWVHMQEPYEVEGCFECQRFQKEPGVYSEEDHQAALKAHREECGCQWPEHDYQNAAMAWVDRLDESEGHNLTQSEISELEMLLDVRGVEFMDNLTPATYACSRLIEKVKEGSNLKHLQGLMQLLKLVREKLEKEELKLKDFGEPPEPEIASIKKEMSLEEMIEAAHHRYTDPSILDDYVHEAKGEEASSINNSGVEAQVRFLYEQWGPDGAQAVLFDDFQCTDPECPDAKENPYHDHPKED